MKRQTRVVIVGGGFGGLKTALELAKHHDFLITLVASDTIFNYYPSLYHTAAGGSRVVSSIPIGELIANKPIQMIKGEATKVDRTQKTLSIKGGKKLTYDVLVLSLGSVTNYFGINGLADNSYSVKSVEKAEALKAHLQEQLINAHTPDLNYIVVGAGPTGIEFSSVLPDYIHKLMKKYYIGRKPVKVELIEAKKQILPALPKSTSRAITRRLRRLGIKVMTNATVQGETKDVLLVNDTKIESKTVIWTAGIANNPFFDHNDFELSPRKKVVVDEYLSAGDDIYVIGDNAETTYSGMAQTALHDAVSVANNLVREYHDQPKIPYRDRKPVYIIPVGERWAAVVWGRLRFYGWLGWTLRLAADWIGYRDFEPWWKATARTMANIVDED